MKDKPTISQVMAQTLVELDRKANPTKYAKAEREQAERRAELARDILLAMAPNVIEVFRNGLTNDQVQQTAEACADLAVRTADALIERLNRKN